MFSFCSIIFPSKQKAHCLAATDFYCSLIDVVCSRIGDFFSSARVNQNTVYCQAACVFDVKRGERSASVPMETVCVR